MAFYWRGRIQVRRSHSGKNTVEVFSSPQTHLATCTPTRHWQISNANLSATLAFTPSSLTQLALTCLTLFRQGTGEWQTLIARCNPLNVSFQNCSDRKQKQVYKWQPARKECSESGIKFNILSFWRAQLFPHANKLPLKDTLTETECLPAHESMNWIGALKLSPIFRAHHINLQIMLLQ